MNGVVIALGAFAGTRHRERIALIEKGTDASIFGDKSFNSYRHYFWAGQVLSLISSLREE